MGYYCALMLTTSTRSYHQGSSTSHSLPSDASTIQGGNGAQTPTSSCYLAKVALSLQVRAKPPLPGTSGPTLDLFNIGLSIWWYTARETRSASIVVSRERIHVHEHRAHPAVRNK